MQISFIKQGAVLKKINKKKILVIGSISDFGGREVEVNSIVRFLEFEYTVKLFSTIQMTEKSSAVYGLHSKWTTVYREFKNSSILLRFLIFIIKRLKKTNLPSEQLVINKISRNLVNFRKRGISLIKREIDNVDAILFCGVFSNGFLIEILEYCVLSKKSCFFRTTGTIAEVPDNLKFFLNKLSNVIVHSSSNALVLKESGIENSSIIDQTTLYENDLLNIPICETDELRYGFIGRFSNEKGILELLDSFNSIGKKLLIAGNGPLLNKIENKCVENSLFTYIGEILQTNLSDFFNKIDVLIIPSFEESGPLVGIEAMAAGKIIISTRVGAMMDRLKDTKNQFWFDISENETLAHAISQVDGVTKLDIFDIRNELRQKYLCKYSIKAISKSYLDLFRELS